MCLKIGQQIEAVEEARNLARIYTEEYNHLWRLIEATNTSLQDVTKKFFNGLEQIHPELKNYEFAFNHKHCYFTITAEKDRRHKNAD